MVNRLFLLLVLSTAGCSTFEDPGSVTLQPECTADAECGDGQTCQSGRCETGANNGVNNGANNGCDLVCEQQADRCDGNLRVVHDGPGTVTADCACDYDAVERQINCADDDMLCRDGECVSRCVEVDCTAPEPVCDGDVVVGHTGPGTCDDADATCDFSGVLERTDCAAMDPVQVCREGGCVDLCAEVTCELPATECDADTLVVAVATACDPQEGACAHEFERTDCTNATPSCDGDDRIIYIGDGSCADAACLPPDEFERQPCEFGCHDGSCRSSDTVFVEPGTFLALGSESATLRGGFLVMVAEVTRADHARWVGELEEDATCNDDLCPVRGLSWFDAVQIANARSTYEGLTPCYDIRTADPEDQSTWSVSVMEDGLYACRGYRLPTEAEWEYAHRAGAETIYLCGDDVACLDAVAWHADNSDGEPHAVRGKSPNAWGLHDIAGNVAEHVHDWFVDEGDRVYGTDPLGPDTGSARISRDCHFGLVATDCGAASNRSLSPSDRLPTHGVRLVRSLRCTDATCPALDPECEGDVLFERDEPGTCDWVTAACTYDPQETVCTDSETVCQEGACVDLCTDVECPIRDPRCDGDTEITDSAVGTCQFRTGACDYTEVRAERLCADSNTVCLDGGCTDLCIDTDCIAPARSCDGQTAVTYEGDGSCIFTDGSCDYDEVEVRTDCLEDDRVCVDGECIDLCAEITCPAQEPVCDGNTRVTHNGPGTCDPLNGQCVYDEVEVRGNCEDDEEVCADGACVNLCPEDACPIPEATCDGDNRLQYIGPGVCDWPTGDCDYAGVTVTNNCADDETICQDGTCVDLCPVTACPPTQECTFTDDLLLNRAPGECAFRTGECTYDPDQQDLLECDHCAQGACFRRVEAGAFLMGSAHDGRGISTTLTRPYYMQATEVNHLLLETLELPDPSFYQGCGAHCPIDNVTWMEQLEVANRLSELENLTPCYTIQRNDSDSQADWTVDISGGINGDPYTCDGYRLPTEAEWERAYRAGSDDPWYCGRTPMCVPDIAWFFDNVPEPRSPRPVALLMANAYGLWDMGGNNSENTFDVHSDELFGGTDPLGPPQEAGATHVNRGGSFSFGAINVSALERGATPILRRYNNVGMRLTRTIPDPD